MDEEQELIENLKKEALSGNLTLGQSFDCLTVVRVLEKVITQREEARTALAVFRDAWEAKMAWGSHALQNPCACAPWRGAACKEGVRLFRDAMRIANIANTFLASQEAPDAE